MTSLEAKTRKWFWANISKSYQPIWLKFCTLFGRHVQLIILNFQTIWNYNDVTRNKNVLSEGFLANISKSQRPILLKFCTAVGTVVQKIVLNFQNDQKFLEV